MSGRANLFEDKLLKERIVATMYPRVGISAEIQ